MKPRMKPIGSKNAQRVAIRFILDRYPYSNVDFEPAIFKTEGKRQVYEFVGYCRLIKWPYSVGRQSQLRIQVDAHSAAIIGHHGAEQVLTS